MLLTCLFSAIIENIFNIFYRYSKLRIAHQLDNKILRLYLKEFQIPFEFFFSKKKISILTSKEEEYDCSINTNLNVLLKLHNFQQLIALIHKGDIEIKGDIKVIQNFILLIDINNFDIAEFISIYAGDVFAENISIIFNKIKELLYKEIHYQQHYISGLLTEEWQLVPGVLEEKSFIKEINSIKCAVDTLIKRIEKLESK